MQDDKPTWCVECDDSVSNCTCWNSKRIKELEKELTLKDSWVKHHQTACEIAMADRLKAKKIIQEAFSLVNTISYSEENGKRCFDANEFVWLDKARNILKKAALE